MTQQRCTRCGYRHNDSFVRRTEGVRGGLGGAWYAAYESAPLRSTRAQAERDMCAHYRERFPLCPHTILLRDEEHEVAICTLPPLHPGEHEGVYMSGDQELPIQWTEQWHPRLSFADEGDCPLCLAQLRGELECD